MAAHQLLTGAHVSTGARGKTQGASAEPMEAATHALMGRLLEAWSECTPSQLSAAPEAASAACCRAILVCAICLLDLLPQGAVANRDAPDRWPARAVVLFWAFFVSAACFCRFSSLPCLL